MPPFQMELLTKRKKIKREILGRRSDFLKKRVAILGGSTTHDVRDALDLFLLNHGIRAEFYESEYGQYWQDAMFPNPVLEEFHPDIIYLHTSNRNILRYPELRDSSDNVDGLLAENYDHFAEMWERLAAVYGCPLIQIKPPPALAGGGLIKRYQLSLRELRSGSLERSVLLVYV